MRVSARRSAIVAGLVAGVYLAILFSVRRVPDWVLRAVGGPGGVERDGGLVLRYRPPASYDAAKLDARAERSGATIRRDAGRIILEVPGVGQGEADDVAAMVTHGGLEFREVIEDPRLTNVPHETIDHEDFVAPGVRMGLDQWRPPNGDGYHAYSYLIADSPAQLSAAFAQLASRGWSQPAHTIIAFERIEPWPGDKVQRMQWRSYLLGDEVLLDGDAVASAAASTAPNTGYPIVQVELDRDGAARFAEITARLVGRKHAIVVGGEVRSAPIVNDAIRDGRVWISMGAGADVLRQEHRAAALARSLMAPTLPPGGVVEEQRWVRPASIALFLGLARLAIGVIGGALIGLLVGISIRVAGPVWRSPVPRPAGRFPIRRVIVTLLAPVALVVLGAIPLPGIDAAALSRWYAPGRAPPPFSIIELGVGPIVAAHVLVELAALAHPRWRRVRCHPAARITIGRWVALLGVVLALAQSYFAVDHVTDLQRMWNAEPALGLSRQLVAIASLTTGTLLLVIVAGMIRQHGLGNGYGAVIASGWAIAVTRQFLDGPFAGSQLRLAVIAAVGGATLVMLRMRIERAGEAVLRVPSSGQVPLLTVAFVAGIRSLLRLGRFGQFVATGGTVGAASAVLGGGWYLVGSLVVLVPLWSLAFSRPVSIAPLAAHAQLAPPGQASWRRATLLSLVILLLVAAGSLLAALDGPEARALVDAALAMIAAAVLLDALDDLQARRADLVAVWPLQHAQHAELVHRVLSDAGIECHLQASHLRTLLAFFGSYAPIDVLVPAAAAEGARARIEPLFRDMAVAG
jgi:hypothetical protein